VKKKSGEEDRKTIVIVVHRGKNLAPKDPSGTSDPYVKVKYGELERKTPIEWQNLTPKWDPHNKGEFYDKFTFSKSERKYHSKYPYVFQFSYEERSEILIECWDKDAFDDDFMGQFRVPEPLATLKEISFFLEENPKKSYKKKSNTKKSDTKKSITRKKSFSHVSGTITISLLFYDKNDKECC